MGRDCCGGGLPDTEIHLDFMNGTTNKTYSHDHSHSHDHDHSNSKSYDHSHDHNHASSGKSIIMEDSDDEEEKKRRKREKREKKERKLAEAKEKAAAAAAASSSGYNYSALGLLALFILPILFSGALYVMNIFNPQDPKIQHYKDLIRTCYDSAAPDKVGKIDEFLTKYKDREYVILSILTDKYGDKYKECRFKK